jgi:hypothetical protein
MISNFLQKNKNVFVGEREKERLVSKSLLGKYKNIHMECEVYVDFGINNNFL